MVRATFVIQSDMPLWLTKHKNLRVGKILYDYQDCHTHTSSDCFKT